MDISIRFSRETDLKEYTGLLQKIYQTAYTNDKIGLTKDCFSMKVFLSQSTQEYLKSNLVVNKKQKTWLAFLGGKLVGSVTVVDKGKEFELKGFYVNLKVQGKGIGKMLWDKASGFAIGKDITLDLYAHNAKAIQIYKRWGFKIDKEKGVFYRHWPEWPENLKAKCLYMRLPRL